MAIKTEPKGPKPPLAGLVKVVMTYQSDSIPIARAANVMHAISTPVISYSQANIATLATDFYNAWVTAAMPSISAHWTLVACTVTALDGTGLQSTQQGTTIGGASGNANPPQCACCVSWRAPFSWRGGRPRTYLPGVPVSGQVAAGYAALSTGFTAPLAARMVTFLATVNTFTFSGSIMQLGFPSYYTRGAFRPVPLFFSMTSAVVHDRLDSQRRRSGKESVFGVD